MDFNWFQKIGSMISSNCDSTPQVFGRYLPFQGELGAEIFTGGRGHRELCLLKRIINNMQYLRNYEHLKSRSESHTLFRTGKHFLLIPVTKNRYANEVDDVIIGIP